MPSSFAEGKNSINSLKMSCSNAENYLKKIQAKSTHSDKDLIRYFELQQNIYSDIQKIHQQGLFPSFYKKENFLEYANEYMGRITVDRLQGNKQAFFKHVMKFSVLTCSQLNEEYAKLFGLAFSRDRRAK